MKYTFLEYRNYTINDIEKVFENETREDFFRICKMMKFTINQYPGIHKYKKQVRECNTWLQETLNSDELKIWNQILEESNYINLLYEDLYNEPSYKEANSIASTRELSAFILAVEYELSVLKNIMLGKDQVNFDWGIEVDIKEEINDINDKLLYVGELFDNICIEVKNVLEYIMYHKKNNFICDKVNIDDIDKAFYHLQSVIKKKLLDMIVESWQFGDLQINMNGNTVECTNDNLGKVVRTYWEIRERSISTTQAIALDYFGQSFGEELNEEKEIKIACFILEKQLFIKNCDCSCIIEGRDKIKTEVNILHLVKTYVHLKKICFNHLKERNIKFRSGCISKVCVKIKKSELKKQLSNLFAENLNNIIKIYTYEQGKDIIDAPLISDGQYYYIIPTLIFNAQIPEVILSLANSFNFRGIGLEHNVIDVLKGENIACSRLKLFDEVNYECDVVFELDKNLFLVECKAWGYPKSITEYYQMNDKIIKAGKQLERNYLKIKEDIGLVLCKLGLDKNYEISNIYKIFLSNFQRGDEQELDDTFICDFNSFKGIIEKIPSGILVVDKNSIIGKIPSESMNNNRITSEELVDYLKMNQLSIRTKKLLVEEEFCEPINNIYIKNDVLKRNVPMTILDIDNITDDFQKYERPKKCNNCCGDI
jgi:hypothetical protein